MGRSGVGVRVRRPGWGSGYLRLVALLETRGWEPGWIIPRALRREWARELGLSPSTVGQYMARVRRELGYEIPLVGSELASLKAEVMEAGVRALGFGEREGVVRLLLGLGAREEGV